MATEIDELIVQIKADTKQLNTQLRSVRGQLDKTFPKGNGQGSPTGRFAGALRGLLGPLAAVATAMAGIAAVKEIAKVSMQFEDLKDRLDTVYGSMKAGDKAMNDVMSFAQTTPFQVEDVTKAFIALQSAGIEPTKDMLQTFADTAAVSVDQLGVFEALVRVTQRSASGGLGLEELNMIMDRGIDVLGILSTKLQLSKNDIAAFGQTAEGARIIMAALTEGLNEKFGGSMENKMDNLSTKTSNMQIAFKALLDEIGKGGLIDFLKETADYFQGIASSITTILQARREGITTEAKELMAPDAEGNIDKDALRKQLLADIRTASESLGFAIPSLKFLSERPGMEGSFMAVAGQVQKNRERITGSLAAIGDALGEGARDEAITAAVSEIRKGLEKKSDIEGGSESGGIAKGMLDALGDLEEELQALFEAGKNIPITTRFVFDEGNIPSLIAQTQEEADKISKKVSVSNDETSALKEAGRIQLQATDAAKMLEEIADPLDEIRAMIKDLDALELLKDKDGKLQFTANQIEELRTHLQGVLSDAKSDELTEFYGDLQSAIEGTVTPAEALEQKIADMQALLDAGNAEVIKFLFGDATGPEIEAIMEKLRLQLTGLKDKADETSASFAETMAPAIASMAHTFTNDFVNALTSGQDALSAFKDFAKNIVNQIIATFLQMAIVNQILNAVFDSIPGYQAQPTISFGGGGSTSSAADAAAAAGVSASGGAMIKGKPYLVGERGPEMFIPHTAGTLKNGNDTKSMMSGNGRPIIVNQNLNFSTGVVPTVRAEVQRMLPQISEITKTSVLEATRRGGNYRKGLLGA